MPPTETTTPIVVEALSKAYGRGATTTPVLRDVTLSVERGQWVFLVGPSGSGKTTLLSILGCVLSPDEGRVEVLGHDVRRLDPRAAAEMRLRHIGFIFQRFHLVRGLTAEENVCVPLTLQGVAEAAARRRAAELLDAVALGEHRHKNVRKLSVGQCQRVALARALVTNPDLILADEPTASLDGEHGHAAMELLRELTGRSGATVVVVTHDPRIQAFADRVLKLENGRLVDGDDPLAGQAVGRFGGQNAREGSANHRPPAARVPLPASVGDVVHAPADPPQPMLVSE